jgi:hypothetical protein
MAGECGPGSRPRGLAEDMTSQGRGLAENEAWPSTLPDRRLVC